MPVGREANVSALGRGQAAYIPSRRRWQEGGYEVADFFQYVVPADRWARGVEGGIAEAVEWLVTSVRK
jgi:hypothetical protein